MFTYPESLEATTRQVLADGQAREEPFHWQVAPMLPAGVVCIAPAQMAHAVGGSLTVQKLYVTVLFDALDLTATSAAQIQADFTSIDLWVAIGMSTGYALAQSGRTLSAPQEEAPNGSPKPAPAVPRRRGSAPV